MSLLGAEFPELYARHLCRHSQFWLNVNHLIAVIGTWLGLYGVAGWLLGLLSVAPWLLVVPAAAYLLVIAGNIPLRVLVATAVFIALLLGTYLAVPMPVWVYLLLLPVSYEFQQLGHKIWNIEHDMTEFNAKYRKGRLLFVVLTVYEAPILLNYLVFDRKNWV
jgi:hypothetical protein